MESSVSELGTEGSRGLMYVCVGVCVCVERCLAERQFELGNNSSGQKES